MAVRVNKNFILELERIAELFIFNSVSITILLKFKDKFRFSFEQTFNFEFLVVPIDKFLTFYRTFSGSRSLYK